MLLESNVNKEFPRSIHHAPVTSNLASDIKLAHHGQGGGGTSSADNTGPKSFESKILPVSDCAPRIFSQFPASVMISIDQGGYTPFSRIGTASSNRVKLSQPQPGKISCRRNPQGISAPYLPGPLSDAAQKQALTTEAQNLGETLSSFSFFLLLSLCLCASVVKSVLPP